MKKLILLFVVTLSVYSFDFRGIDIGCSQSDVVIKSNGFEYQESKAGADIIIGYIDSFKGSIGSMIYLFRKDELYMIKYEPIKITEEQQEQILLYFVALYGFSENIKSDEFEEIKRIKTKEVSIFICYNEDLIEEIVIIKI